MDASLTDSHIGREQITLDIHQEIRINNLYVFTMYMTKDEFHLWQCVLESSLGVRDVMISRPIWGNY